MSAPLSHTLEVRPNLFIRAFIKFYGLKPPYGLNTCKLFWGTIGMVVIPLLLLTFSPLIALIVLIAYLDHKAEEKKQERRTALRNMTPEERKAYYSPPKSTRADKLEKFTAWAGAVWFKIATPVTWFFRFAVGAAVAFVLYLLIKLLLGWAIHVDWGAVLIGTGFALVGLAVLAVLAFFAIRGYASWREKHPKPLKPLKPKKRSVVKAVFNSIHDHTCANVEVSKPV